MDERERDYLALLLEPVRSCASYRPHFGRGGKRQGLTLEQFQTLYRDDLFYSWFGLDHPLVYAAHKAAGGITSIYRQIGIGCERLFRAVLRDALGLSEEEVSWSYQVPLSDGRARMLYLDARVPLDSIADPGKRERLRGWLRNVARAIGVDEAVLGTLKGVVFEVRQGYKSKDSKRQNADIANAAAAYAQAYLPCLVVLSNQIDADILDRYRAERWVVLTGLGYVNDVTVSTYDFMRDVVGYDLAMFFQEHRELLRKEITAILEVLLTPQA